jgi:hypothetical protein
MPEPTGGGSVGPATDQRNNPVIDPTENVKALNAAEAKRQDGLREKESKHLREILNLRSKHAIEMSRLQAELINEKFAASARIETLTESHRLELKADSEKQISAALAAADRYVAAQNQASTLAVDRAVAGMKELIVNNQQVNSATTNALGDKVEDLKASVAVLVNTRLGAQEQKVETREQKVETRGSFMTVQGAVLMAVAIMSLVIAAVAIIIGTR